MKLLTILFLGSLLLGQLGGISPWPGLVVYVHDVILAILVVLYVKKVRRLKLIIPIAVFIGASVLSLLVNLWRFPLPEVGLGSLYLVRWVLIAGIYAIVVQHKEFPWLRWLYFIGIGFAILGFAQFILYPDLRNLAYLGWDPHYYRLFSTLLDPNYLGLILVLTLFLGWTYMKENLLWILPAQLLTFIALLLTYSRSSYLAFIAGMLVITIAKKRWNILGGVVAFILIITFLPHPQGSILDILRLHSTEARIGNWQESLKLITKAPVFGYGFNTLRYLSPATGDIVSKAAAGLDSSILFILATTGIVGLAAYGYLIFSMLRMGRTNVVYFLTFTALGVHSLFVNSAFYPWVMIWIWILTGAVTCDT